MKVVFVDTGFWIARFNPNDTQSERAAAAAKALGPARYLTTEMVLSEFLAAFAKVPLRVSAVQAVRAITASRTWRWLRRPRFSSAKLSRKCGFATFLDPRGGRPAPAGLGALLSSSRAVLTRNGA